MNNVACIITVYKNDNPIFFKEALDSIIGQTYGIENINIYLGIDGNIPKELEEIISSNDKFIYKIVKNSQNSGLAFTLNKLIDNLENELYIFRMDSDDICLLDRFETQVKFMHENESIMICGSSIIEINNNKEHLFTRNYPRDLNEAKNYIYKASIFAHPSVCFKKGFFNLGYRYNSKNRFNEDIELWYKVIIDKIEISNLDKALLYFRKNDNFYKRRGLKKAFKEFQLYFNGNQKLFGLFNWRQLFPILRLITRLLPAKIVEYIYQSKLRKKLNKA